MGGNGEPVQHQREDCGGVLRGTQDYN